MRYDVKKFLFISIEEERNVFFRRSQELGIINFINSKPIHPTGDLRDLKAFIKARSIIRGLPVISQEEGLDDAIGLDLAYKIVGTKESLDKLYEEERIISSEISRIEVFGDFLLEDLAYIESHGKRKVQFYCAKRGYAEKTHLPDNVIYVASDHGLDYFIAINKEPTKYHEMIEMEIPRSQGELKHQEIIIKNEISLLEPILKEYAKYNTFLHRAFIRELNEYNLKESKDYVNFPVDDQQLFVIEGWVPADKIDELNQLVKETNVFIEEIKTDPQDVVPTYLDNSGVSRIGQDLVHIYDTPSNTDKDPSLWVLVFFALFFSMIIGDGGYGLLLLLIALYIRYKHSGLKNQKKRALNLLTILGFSCLIWGLLSTSFFGIKFAPDSPIRKVSVITWLAEKKAEYHIEIKDGVYSEWIKKYPGLADVEDPEKFLVEAAQPSKSGGMKYEAFSKFSDNIMMELALLIGVIHIIFSMSRHLSRNWAYLGWIMLIIGGYLYVPSFLEATSITNFVFGLDRDISAKYGLYMIFIGFSIAVLIALIQHKWVGLLEATVIIQIFGDVISYLRLYALGLSGALLTETMTDLAASVPLIFGILILGLGHVVNIILGVMGGVIHGLRLNFLEWYHYSFEGGGRMFNPLRKLDE